MLHFCALCTKSIYLEYKWNMLTTLELRWEAFVMQIYTELRAQVSARCQKSRIVRKHLNAICHFALPKHLKWPKCTKVIAKYMDYSYFYCAFVGICSLEFSFVFQFILLRSKQFSHLDRITTVRNVHSILFIMIIHTHVHMYVGKLIACCTQNSN